VSYTVRIAAKPFKFLEGLQDRNLRRRITNSLRALGGNPRPASCIKLSGPEALYRIRIGDYRVVYQIQDAMLMVLVVRIAHRREVYRGS
jgi:mRNA interferase RelE/StbE